MKHTPTTKAILAKNPHALQALHNERYFDFESPFFSATVHGKFTKNSIKKLIPDFDKIDYETILLIQCNSARYFNSKLYAVSYFDNGFDLNPIAYGFSANLDHFWGVGDFETARKEQTETVYIIAQAREHLKRRENRELSANYRYTVLDKTRGYDGQDHYLSQIEIAPRDFQHQTFRWRPSVNPWEPKTENIFDYIDKSGYMVHSTRGALRFRANRRKAEKEKARLEAFDFSEKYSEISEKVKTAKAEICQAVNNVENYTDMCDISRAVHQLQRGILGADDLPKKHFSCIEKKQIEIENILQHLNNAIQIIEESKIPTF